MMVIIIVINDLARDREKDHEEDPEKDHEKDPVEGQGKDLGLTQNQTIIAIINKNYNNLLEASNRYITLCHS
jgi:hypothetical protein